MENALDLDFRRLSSLAVECRDWPFCGLVADWLRTKIACAWAISPSSRHGFRCPTQVSIAACGSARRGAARHYGRGLRPTLPRSAAAPTTLRLTVPSSGVGRRSSPCNAAAQMTSSRFVDCPARPWTASTGTQVGSLRLHLYCPGRSPAGGESDRLCSARRCNSSTSPDLRARRMPYFAMSPLLTRSRFLAGGARNPLEVCGA